MGQATALGSRRRAVATAAAVVAAAAAYSYMAAGSRPFSSVADAYTAVPYVFGCLLLVRTLRRRPPGRVATAALGRRLLPWVVAVALFCLWELVTYFAGFGGDRHGFPTASYLLDLADRTRPAKAAVFAAWLALGWGLVRR